ncbi:CG8958, partial [Drosophila busckii]
PSKVDFAYINNNFTKQYNNTKHNNSYNFIHTARMSKRTKDDDGHRRKKARLRFRKCVRSAITNNQWVSEMEDQGVTLNVKKNVAMLVRKKHKPGILTMAQKSLLATAHSTRTIEERKKICSIVAHLGCFSQVPPKIRARLVPHLLFVPIAANRQLMKEGDLPICVYFLISGEVEMSKTILNKVTRRVENRPEAILGPGDWIGDVDMLEAEIRSNSYKTISQCEILVLQDDDFISILAPYVRKNWVEKKRAIQALSYLSFMNESQAKQQPNSIFLLKITSVKGEVHYELSEFTNDQSTHVLLEENKSDLDIRELLRSSSSLDEQGINKKKQKRQAELQKIEKQCLQFKVKAVEPEEEQQVKRPSVKRRRSSVKHKDAYEKFIRHGGAEGFIDIDDDDVYVDDDAGRASEESPRATFRVSQDIVTRDTLTSKHSRTSQSRESSRVLGSNNETTGSEIFTAASSHISARSLSKEETAQTDKSQYVTHFIDIGSMAFGGLCGVGERTEHRVLMARTTVQCLLLPRYWLMEEEQNPGHIWQRMSFYIDRYIPSRETLFQDYIKTRQWAQFKRSCVEEYIQQGVNSTKVEDIPVIIRIVESKED